MATQAPGAGATPTPPAGSTAPFSFSWNIFGNLLKLSGMTAIQAFQWVNTYWFQLTGQLLVYAGGALILGIAVNVLGWLPVNGYIGLIFVIVGLLTLLSVTMMAIGSVALDAVSGDQKFDKSFKAYLRGVAHVMLFVGLTFLVLSIFRIYNPWAIGIFLLALLSFGLWSIAYQKAKGIYAMVAMVIIVLAMVGAGLKAFTWVSPQAKAIEAAMQDTSSALNTEESTRLEELQGFRAKRGLTAKEQLEWNALTAKEAGRGYIARTRESVATLSEPVKRDVLVTTLDPRILTGLDLPPGCYTFISEGSLVYIGTEPWRFAANVRLNGERPGTEERSSQRICMDVASPPVLSFVEGTPAELLRKPQPITLSFTWAP